MPARGTQPTAGPVHKDLNKDSTEIKRLQFSGNNPAPFDGLEKCLATVMEKLKNTEGNEDGSDVMLILDQPDLLLAATGPGRGIGATEMMEWVSELEQVGFLSGDGKQWLTNSSAACIFHDIDAVC